MKLSSPYERAVKLIAMNRNSNTREGIKTTHINDYIKQLKDELNTQPLMKGNAIGNTIDNNSIANHYMKEENDYKMNSHNQKQPKRYTNNLTTIGEIMDSSSFNNSGLKNKEYNPSYQGENIKQHLIEQENYYYRREPFDHSITSYRNWLKYSINRFKMPKLLAFNQMIDLYTLNSTEITMPMIILLFFMIMMIIKGKFYVKMLYIFIILLPLANNFLVNQLIISLMKFKSHMRKISLVKSITFFYIGFIPICFSMTSTFILRKRSYVSWLCLIIGAIYSAFLNEKYNLIYCGFDINSNSNRVLFFINLILYSFFILLI